MNSGNLLEQVLSALKTNHIDRAQSKLGELLASGMALGDTWLLVAKLAQKMGEVELATQALHLYLASNQHTAHKHLQAAGLMAEMGHIKAALGNIELLQSKGRYDVSLQHFIASARMQLGELDLARKTFTELLKHWPAAGQSWLSFSALTPFNQQEQALAFIQQAGAAVQKSDNISRACYQYALGKAYFDCHEVDLAWSAYQQGASLMASQQHYDVAHAHKVTAAIIDSFKPESFKQLEASKLTTPPPIFVLGWPRTGTTLVEHMLCAHSKVLGGGEIDLLQKSTLAMGGLGCSYAKRYQANFAAGHLAWEHLAKRYHYLAAQRFGQQGCIVDKTLNNSRYLGLIARMFPSAPIIWLQRDPMDAALSCFRTFFSGNQPWSWSLSNIAQHFQQEDKLFKHWHSLIADRILVVPYEQLVKEPAHWQTKILGFCGLSVEPSLSHFYQNDRAVTTSSTVQVRQQVHQNSVAGSKAVAHYMQEFSGSYQINH